MLTFPHQSQALQLKSSQEKKQPTFLWAPTIIKKFPSVKDQNILKYLNEVKNIRKICKYRINKIRFSHHLNGETHVTICKLQLLSHTRKQH